MAARASRLPLTSVSDTGTSAARTLANRPEQGFSSLVSDTGAWLPGSVVGQEVAQEPLRVFEERARQLHLLRVLVVDAPDPVVAELENGRLGVAEQNR